MKYFSSSEKSLSRVTLFPSELIVTLVSSVRPFIAKAPSDEYISMLSSLIPFSE